MQIQELINRIFTIEDMVILLILPITQEGVDKFL